MAIITVGGLSVNNTMAIRMCRFECADSNVSIRMCRFECVGPKVFKKVRDRESICNIIVCGCTEVTPGMQVWSRGVRLHTVSPGNPSEDRWFWYNDVIRRSRALSTQFGSTGCSLHCIVLFSSNYRIFSDQGIDGDKIKLSNGQDEPNREIVSLGGESLARGSYHSSQFSFEIIGRGRGIRKALGTGVVANFATRGYCRL